MGHRSGVRGNAARCGVTPRFCALLLARVLRAREPWPETRVLACRGSPVSRYSSFFFVNFNFYILLYPLLSPGWQRLRAK